MKSVEAYGFYRLVLLGYKTFIHWYFGKKNPMYRIPNGTAYTTLQYLAYVKISLISMYIDGFFFIILMN
jgi:hypothetical protein